MSATAVSEAIVAWAVATLPALQGSYDYPASERDQALPDIAVEVHGEGVSPSNPLGGDELAVGIEQADVRDYTCALLLVVDPEDPQAASKQLYGFVEALAAALKADRTLGGRVTLASPYWRASYEPPFVEFEDGSKGRLATLTLSVSTLA